MSDSPMGLRRYRTVDGRVPFTEWLDKLDRDSAGRVAAHKDRLATGHWGNSRWVADGVWELKIDFGPGYRVYYLRDGKAVVILLCGGHKGSQDADIRQAQEYAADYWRRR